MRWSRMTGWKCTGKDGDVNKYVVIFQRVSEARERTTRTNSIAGTPNKFRSWRLSNAIQEKVPCPEGLKRLCSLYSFETAQH